MEVSTMINHGGEYSSHSTAELFRSSTIYKDLTVAGTTVKNKFATATAKWFKDNVMSHLLTKVGGKYADKIRDLSTQVSDLNKELTGSDMVSPKNEESIRYESTLEMIKSTLKQHRKLGRSVSIAEALVAEMSTKMFGIDSDDSDYEKEEGTFDTDTAKQLQNLRESQKTFVMEQESLLKKFFTKVSGGLHSSKERTNQKLIMPSGKVGTPGKTYIVKMLYFVNSQPEKFGWCVHEIRRTLKDYNKRKGTYYSAPDSSEVDPKIRDRCTTSNSALYKELEMHTSDQDFAAAHRPYSYGTNGGSSSDPWPCAEGNGLRILHFFVTRLTKVACEHIEGIEADLFECPSLFGMGDPQKAVDQVNVILDEAERIDAQVGYRVILRICDVLSQRHPLFGQLHNEKLKPSAITERRNARPELFRLMNEVATILINIGDNVKHWKANQVTVDVGIRICAISAFVEPCRTKGNGMMEYTKSSTIVNQVQEASKADQKRKAENAPDGSRPICRYDGCTRPAFAHKKERGGAVHDSKMCFDHFLLGVEDSKLAKPVGVPIKGGKTMVAKRGEDKKWNYKIFNIRLKSHDKLNMVRQQTFLSQIKDEDADDLLNALRDEMEKPGGMRVYHTEVDNEGFDWNNLVPECEGLFDLPDTGSILQDDEEMKIYDIKRRKMGYEHHNELFVNERT